MTARRQNLQQLDTQSRGTLGLESRKQFIGCGRFVQVTFHNFTASFNADRPGQGETHMRLGSIALARSDNPARRNNHSRLRQKVRLADQAQCRLS
jgi:hypothetical protein